MKEESMRIEKYLSERGIMSRREAKKFLQEGRIFVNNKRVSPGEKFNPKTEILSFDEEIKKELKEKETILVYKPRGVLSSKDTGTGKNIFDVFPQFSHLNTVGRLDKESEGLILLSNDGMVTKAITGRDHLIEKEYVVTVREDVLPFMLKKMSQGIQLEDGQTLPTKTKKLSKNSFSITLREGRKHQIRRMANACNLTVLSLKRIRINTISAPKMLPGNFKKITKEQLEDIKKVLQ